MTGFEKKVHEVQSGPLQACGIKILQVNLGYQCNLACRHCHIEAEPSRTESMGMKVIDQVIDVLEKSPIEILDITGGAPELNPHLRYLVQKARGAGVHLIARTNLSVFFEPGMHDIPGFYAENDVEIIASLPHYMETSVDRVRGSGTFTKSIEALRTLNGLGYGTEQGKKQLHLVYNPPGAFLPSSQTELEKQYRKELLSKFNIVFNRLYTFANMPIGRFRDFLVRTDNYQAYQEKIKGAFNPGTLNGLMCRYMISIGWDGTLYDCDFNQVLGLTVDMECPDHINDFDYSVLAGRKIVTDDHCFACTAGQGST
jgi:radical SAM/Cys-rich protein